MCELIDVSIVHWLMGENGRTFEPAPGVVPDTVNGVEKLRDLYTLADPGCTSRVTVPLLWYKTTKCIVSNESADILRMFDFAFDEHGATPGNYYRSHPWVSPNGVVPIGSERDFDALSGRGTLAR